MTSQALLVIDHRTMALKNRIPMEFIDKISLSPFQDKLAVFHLKKVIMEHAHAIYRFLLSCKN